MKIIYLSSLCSIAEYERLFEKYKTTSSHASQKFHRLMTRGLQENGVEIETVTHRSLKKLAADDLKVSCEQENGITFNYLAQSRFTKLNRIYTVIKAYKKLKELKKANRDMLICVDILKGELSIAANLFRRFNKCRTIAIVTDVPAYRACETRKGLRAIPYKIKNSLISGYDHYVFLTEKMNETLNPRNKPYVIIEGIADDKIVDIPNDLSGKYSEKVVMMAGLLEKEYGADELVEAFHDIKQEDARLHFYGKGKSVALIEEYSEKDSRIKFFGEVLNQKIIEEECKATLLVNPRRAIGDWVKYSFPSKNIEYMASGTPLVAYDLPCIPDEYRDKYISINADGLRETLEKYLSASAEELNSFGAMTRRWILENKTPRSQAKKIINMLCK